MTFCCIPLRGEMGVEFTHYKRPTLNRRIQPANGPAQDRVAQRLRPLPPVQLRVKSANFFNDILIHVTAFFRDSAVLARSTRASIPATDPRTPAPQEPLRVKVPGCSTGEEVYCAPTWKTKIAS